MSSRRSARKTVGGPKGRACTEYSLLFRGTLICSFASLCLAGKSIANPLGEKVRSGSADFMRGGDHLQIRQSSETLVVDWKDFSIKGGESTQFLQPGPGASALNRVHGGNPSSIYGSL